MAVMRGAFIVLIAAFALGRVFDLRVLNFLIRNSFTGLLIALPIIFQPEIRRASPSTPSRRLS
jgi:diadenylate cyclase